MCHVPCMADGVPVIIELKAENEFQPDTGGDLREAVTAEDKDSGAAVSQQSYRCDYDKEDLEAIAE